MRPRRVTAHLLNRFHLQGIAFHQVQHQARHHEQSLLLQGLTYVMATGGKLWSTALRMESQRTEGAAERSVRWVGGWVGENLQQAIRLGFGADEELV